MPQFAQGLSGKTVSVTDFQKINDGLMKVVVATTGKHTAEELREAVTAKLQHMAAPIEGTFRKIAANVMIGFVRANSPVRVESEEAITAGYKVMAKSNILMDESDGTLWRLKQGASGKYLAREGNEDLASLATAALVRRTDVPKIRTVAMAMPEKGEFVAFASASGDIDYGFVAATKASEGRLRLVSASRGDALDITKDEVVASYEVELPREAHKRITASGNTRETTQQSVDYYKKLYAYDPDYLSKVIRDVEGMAAA